MTGQSRGMLAYQKMFKSLPTHRVLHALPLPLTCLDIRGLSCDRSEVVEAWVENNRATKRDKQRESAFLMREAVFQDVEFADAPCKPHQLAKTDLIGRESDQLYSLIVGFRCNPSIAMHSSDSNPFCSSIISPNN
jgi:hypothetical protein